MSSTRRARAAKPALVRVGAVEATPGTCVRGSLPVARLPTQGWLEVPVAVINGAHAGPRIWLSGAIHGDELNGVEIVREIVEAIEPTRLSGTVIAVPVVNVFGFANRSRYMPDRRDLNRSFPGSRRGSLAGRLASLFMREVVAQCDLGVDIHTAAEGRTNVPQVRADCSDPTLRRLANAFGAPVVVHARAMKGTLRAAAAANEVRVLTYEAGEPHRFWADAVRIGVLGVERVMQALDMYAWGLQPPRHAGIEYGASRWVRAPQSGLFRATVEMGDDVEAGQCLGNIGDALAESLVEVLAPVAGRIIGGTTGPIVHQGDGLLHLATERGRKA